MTFANPTKMSNPRPTNRRGSLPLINRNTMSIRSSSTVSEQSTGSRDAKTIMTADGRTGGRRSRPSLRSLRNTDVLRSSTPPSVVGSTVESISRSLSGGQLSKLGKANKVAQTANSAQDNSTSKRRSSNKLKNKNSNSLRFHRVDLEWTGQLENADMAGVAVGRSQSQEDMTIESLNMEIMDLRPSSAHPGLLDSSLISIMDDGAREAFHNALGVSERSEQPSHWDIAEYPSHDVMNMPMNRRASWNSCNSISNSNMDGEINSLSGSIISNMSMSQHSPGRSLRSSDTNDSNRSDVQTKRDVYVKKYVRPIMIIVGLATITAIVIYVLGEGFLEEGFDTLSDESRNAIHNLFGEESGESDVREGGRMEMAMNEVQMPDDMTAVATATELRLNQERRRENRARRAERARRAMEKLRKTEEKNVVIANVGIGNA